MHINRHPALHSIRSLPDLRVFYSARHLRPFFTARLTA